MTRRHHIALKITLVNPTRLLPVLKKLLSTSLPTQMSATNSEHFFTFTTFTASAPQVLIQDKHWKSFQNLIPYRGSYKVRLKDCARPQKKLSLSRQGSKRHTTQQNHSPLPTTTVTVQEKCWGCSKEQSPRMGWRREVVLDITILAHFELRTHHRKHSLQKCPWRLRPLRCSVWRTS